eukprot:5288564-Pyramimonas_sp.AAC.1
MEPSRCSDFGCYKRVSRLITFKLEPFLHFNVGYKTITCVRMCGGVCTCARGCRGAGGFVHKRLARFSRVTKVPPLAWAGLTPPSPDPS